MSRTPFSRLRAGEMEMRLEPEAVDAIRPLIAQIAEAIVADEQPSHLQRLFPPAYADDPQAQEEFAQMTRDDLVEAKVDAYRRADATLDRMRLKRGSLAVRLDEAEQQAWLGVLNDLRLAVGTRLDVTEETYERPIDPYSPDAAAHHLYLYLGWLEEHLVEQLLG